MKTFIQIMLKCFLFFFIVAFLVFHLSPQQVSTLKEEFLVHLLENEEVNLQMIRNALTSYEIEVIEKKWNEHQEVELAVSDHTSKKIYLYNTHQSEEYIDGVTIFEVTYQLAVMLKEAGFEVVFETGDFIEQMQLQNLKYNQLYTISRQYLEDALKDNGAFDLVIDVHRDSAKRSVSIIEQDGVVYGRLMFVIGNKSKNAAQVSLQSHALTDKMNQRISGIMREPFLRQSVYNQDVCDNILLLEVGTDQNTSSEVLRSLQIFVEMLKEEMNS